jgi:hypothetical protein
VKSGLHQANQEHSINNKNGAWAKVHALFYLQKFNIGITDELGITTMYTKGDREQEG